MFCPKKKYMAEKLSLMGVKVNTSDWQHKIGKLAPLPYGGRLVSYSGQAQNARDI